MKRIKIITLLFFMALNLQAEETISNQMQNADKLDVLDKQSKEFFNAITGLEKDYLEEQVSTIKNKKDPNSTGGIVNNQPKALIKEEPKLSQEDYEKYVFTHQNDMAKLTTDFTRTKKLKDLKIKSMYSFNGKDYVVLKLEDETATATKKEIGAELSANIEGRYVEGDSILEHKIININTRTKSIELYKKLDDENGYTIYLSNYGISVSDLIKTQKPEEKKETTKTIKKEEVKALIKEEFPIKKAFEQVPTKEPILVAKNTNEMNSSCLYTVKKQNLNVRDNSSLDGKILRVLKIDDKFSIKQKVEDWVQIDTIYKKISGDVMKVLIENNWVQIVDDSVSSDKNCI
ncbi:MAG: hypothetical protein PHG81_03130 [Aliarcobacter sp.]|nr:hypothetical protein [Aliarcobacter sp.]